LQPSVYRTFVAGDTAARMPSSGVTARDGMPK
jgi:hypothetical protein